MRTALPAALSLSALLLACGAGGVPSKSALLKEKDRQFVQETLQDMRGTSRLVLVSDRAGCKYCETAEGFLKGVAAQSPQVAVEVLSLRREAARAGALGIDKVPGTAILGTEDFGIRYYGFPGGYEFIPFVEAIRNVAESTPKLAPETVTALATLKKPVTITVFVTQS